MKIKILALFFPFFFFAGGCLGPQTLDEIYFDFDGVYDAQPFNQCLCPGRVLMSVKNGNVKVYGPHNNLEDYGTLQGNRWLIWDGYEVIVCRTKSGLSMQIPGVNEFLELPRVSMTQADFERLLVDEKASLSSAPKLISRPPLVPYNRYTAWSMWQLWHKEFGYGPKFPVGKRFELDVSIENPNVFITLTSIWDKSFGIVFNPTNYQGSVVVAGNNRKGEIIEIVPSEKSSFHMVSPGQVFQYTIPLDELSTQGKVIDIGTNDLVFAQIKIDVPPCAIVSENTKGK